LRSETQRNTDPDRGNASGLLVAPELWAGDRRVLREPCSAGPAGDGSDRRNALCA